MDTLSPIASPFGSATAPEVERLLGGSVSGDGQATAGCESSVRDIRRGREWIEREERMERAGEILFRAACRAQAPATRPDRPAQEGLTDIQQEILRTVAGFGAASPEQILDLVRMSRATVARGLRVLLARGLVIRAGRTRRARYTLSSKQKTSESPPSSKDAL
jgi:DNA-binding MarR family transcriptional regulator